MAVKLTTLCENTSGASGVVAEWGWSIFVQTDELNILFDTGGGFAAVRNADKFGIDLKSIDKIVLSHGHADHTGGIREFLERAQHPEVIAHPGVWDRKFSKAAKDEAPLYRGIPFIREELEKYATFTLSRAPVHLSENVMTTGEIPRRTEFETIESTFFVMDGETLKPDEFFDDLALICKTKGGLVIVLGCAHRGIINIISHAREIAGEKTIHTVIGGTHLFPKKEAQVELTISALGKIGVQNLGVSHCTGMDAAIKLKAAFEDSFFFNNAGSTRIID
jgi:7,8-dihydropterin-6-yl-methyl-4-(beta-D-ribofuranosyl)aminobenzene 5'-phosphate synthase